MKNQSVETKPRHKYSASQNFYNFKNNDFLKTNLILHQTIQVKTSPDDVLFDEDTYLKLIKNNQGISGALNSRKFTSKNLPSKSERNSSTPVLLPLDLKSVKTSLPVTDFTLDPLKPSGRDMKGSSLHFTPSKPLNSSQAMSVLLSPAQTNSARISTARTDSFPMISPRGYQSKKSLFGMTPEEVQSLEKQILAKTKLDRDRSETMSRVNTRNENKRDVSYFSERNAKPYLPSQVNSPGVGSMQFINNGGQNDSQTATMRTTPEPVLTVSVGQGENIEKAARLTHGSSFKKNTDFTSIEEEGPESKEIEGNGSVSRRMITVSVGAKKNSIDYSVQQNALGLHKGHIASLSGLPTTSLNDYLFKAHNLPLSPVNRSVKPMTAGTIDSKVMPRMFDSPRRKIKFDIIDFKKNDSDDLLNEIRREIPNILTGAPPSRQDVLVLSNWMNSKIKQIADDPKLKEDEKSIKYDKLYNICINEVFRQVSLECAERGDLLYRIWSCYFQIFTQCKMNLDGEIQRLKLEHQKENQKQYEWHQKFIEKKDQELEDCKLEIQRLLKSQEEDQNKIAKLLHRNTKYKQKIDQLKGVLAVTKAQVEEIKDENRRYAKRLAYKIANSTKGTYVPTFLASHGPKDNNAREASVPENLGVGSSLASPMKLTIPLTPDTVKVEGNIRGFRTEENEQSDSSGSDESSLDFVYEDTATNAKHVFKIDHLNNNVLINKKINSDENEQEAAAMLRGQALGVRTIQTCTKETQTNLVLAETKYDGVLDNQKVVDELVTELKVKRDIDVMAELDDIPSLDLSRIYDNLDLKDSKVLKRTFSWQTLAARTMVEDRMDGLAKHSGTPRSEFIRSLKKKLFPGSSENATPKSGVFNGNSDFHKLTKMLDGEAPNSSHKKMGGEYQFKIIEEEKTLSGEIKYKGTSTSPVTKNTNYLFVCEPIQEQLETNEDGKSFVKSLSGINRDSDDQQNKDVSIEVDEKQEALEGLEELEGQETHEEVLQENLQANKTEFVSVGSPVPKKKEVAFYESVQNTPKAENMSITSDDLFHNLNEVAAEFGDVEKASKYGSMVEPRDSHNNSLDENLQGDGVIKKQTKKFGSFDDEQEPRRAFSLSTLVNTKTHAMHLVSMMQTKKEDLAILDKAKLLTVMRMYKVEKEKNKVLQSSVVELEEQIMNEKEHQGKMKDNMDEMKVHIKMLEQLKAKCPHGKCSLCKKEEDAEFEEGEGEGEGSSRQNLDLSSSDNKTGVREAEGEVDEVEEEDENEGDDNDNDEAGVDLDALGDGDDEEYNDAGNMTPGGRGGETPIHRMSRQMTIRGLKKKKVTTGQQPEFHKKKVVNQNQLVSAALAIIMKVKEKKLTKFRNFMPIKSVLKTIHVLYGDRINQAKDNSSVKDDEFFVFAYKWFMNNFGFRKIAEQKYIIFLLSVKKYLHVVRINLFARFMSLLQGSSNFNADEFSKYLEGVEIINNSTLGIPIVSSETDSKIYVPFLRGLEYLRYFSENKLATDEYIEFKREFEALKVADPKNINRNGIVDIDLFMTKVLTKYRIICNRTKQFVVNAFKAADLDANKYCSLKEFLLIYRNIDPDRFDHGFAENLFNEHADIKIQGEINLSFDKFTVVCVEYGLFSDLQQDQFLGIQNQQEMEELMQKTRSQWSIHYAETTRKLNGSGSITEGEKAYWFSILKILNERITDFEKLEPNDVKPLLIAFKILDQEVEKLRENEAVRDVYGVKIRKSEIKETVEGMM